MKFCQIEIVKELNSIKDIAEREEVKEKIADALTNSVDEAIIKKAEIESWIADSSNAISSNSIVEIVGFFETKGNKNNVAHNRIRGKIVNKIVNSLFNSAIPATNNHELNIKLNSLIKFARTKEGYSKNQSNKYIHINQVMNIANEGFAAENDEKVINYLIANHMDLLVKSWFKDLISINNGRYSYAPKHKIRTDWNSENFDTMEPDVNSLIDVMLSTTAIKMFNKNGDILNSNNSIEKQAFITSAKSFFEKLTNEELKLVVENPYKILDLMFDRFSNSVNDITDNILASFMHDWIYDLSNKKQKTERKFFSFFKNGGRLDFDGHSPLDIFVNAFFKYALNRYYEIDVNNPSKVDKIDGGEDGIIAEMYSKIVNNLSVVPLSPMLIEAINSEDYIVIKSQIESIFGFDVDMDKEGVRVIAFLKEIARFKEGKTKSDDLSEHLEKTFYSKGLSYYNILKNIIKSNNKTNPAAITGSKKNHLDKSLPTNGISSVASNLKLEIFRNDEKVKDLKFDGVPVYRKGFLYESIMNGDDIYNGTYYLGSIYSNDEVKELGDLSIQEQFRLSFVDNFLRGWTKNGEIRIEAITPSDKKRIPFFSFNAFDLKSKFGNNIEQIESNVIDEMQKIYGQYLLNVLNDFSRVLNRELLPVDFDNIEGENNVEKLNNLLSAVVEINKELSLYKSSDIQQAVHNYNVLNDTNLLISNINDYAKTSKGIEISPYLVESIKRWTEPINYIMSRFRYDINDLKGDIGVLNTDIGSWNLLDLSKIEDDKELKAKSGHLYTYFLINAICSENVLINTVGLPFSHKYGSDQFDTMDSKSHITMVKRMVALTATSHSMMKGVLNGQPNIIKTMVWDNDVAEMAAFSAKSTSGNNPIANLDVLDGLMVSTRISDNLTKQSITDVKPYGNALKYLIHDFRPDKGCARLTKMASNSIDNAYLRAFSYKIDGVRDPEWFIKMQLSDAKILPYNIVDGYIVDYNGIWFMPDTCYYKDSAGVIHTVSDIRMQDENTVLYKVNGVDFSCNNDLYSIWKNVFGGEFSCNSNGDYDESSMDNITMMLNKLGRKLSDNVNSQKDVDQYAKKACIMYFPTSSAEKSLKPLTTNLDEAIMDPSKRWITSVGIEHFGIQLDPDHDAVDSKVHEITQMMSYLSEKGLVNDVTSNVYKKLVDLIDILQNTTFIDKSALMNDEQRSEYKKELDKIFGEKIIRVFSDPSLDIISLANEISRELNKVGNLKVPYSDHQFLFKLHTSVGSYFNKFISRDWPGRADTLMGSSGIAMIMEDEDGIQYLANGKKNGVSIKYYMDELFHPEGDTRFITNAAKSNFVIEDGELEPFQQYYVVEESTNLIIDKITLDKHSKLVSIKDQVKNKIYTKIVDGKEITRNGIIYVKALNQPRDLKTKNVVITVNDENGTHKCNWWNFKTHLEIINAKQNKLSKQEVDALEDKMERALYSLAKLRSGDFSDINDIYIVEEETGLKGISQNNFSIEIFDDEKLSTNPYSNIYGDNDMCVSDIKQQKEKWFENNLNLRCANIDESRTTFYSTNGSILVFVDKNDESFDSTKLIKVIPVIDEDGYRVDESMRYKIPENAEFYEGEYQGRKVEYIVADSEAIFDIAASKSFVFYRGQEMPFKNITYIKDDNDIKKLAEIQYKDWLDCSRNMVSRIPAQNLSFGMIMSTVGYLPWKNNVSMVNNMHVYMEGSDYDIDKITMMFKALSGSGIIVSKSHHRIMETNNDVFDHDDSSISFNNEIIELMFMHAQITLDKSNAIINDELISTYNNSRRKFVDKWSKFLENNDILLNTNYIINQIVIQGGSDLITKRALRSLINDVKRQIAITDTIKSLVKGQTLGLQNLLLDDIKEVYDDPRTWLSATTPTTMAPINDVVESEEFEAANRYHLSISTNIRVNRTTLVGKAGVGITANGQKAAYAIEYYNSVKYNNKVSTIPNNKPFILHFPESMAIDGNKDWVYFIHPGSKINEATYKSIIDYVSKNGNNIGQYEFKIIDNELYKRDGDVFIKLNIGDRLDNFYPTDIISSLISSCTDNAKEMKIDLINGTEETLPGYIFCIMMGMNIKQAYNIFGHKIIPYLISEARGNIYDGTSKTRISQVISNLKDKKEYSKFVSKYNISDDISNELTALDSIFKGADILTTLSSILGINGGIDVNFGAPTLYRLKTESSIKGLFKSDINGFNLYDFVFKQGNNQSFINKLNSQHGIESVFNILDIINTVPHYNSMMKVPLQFENAIRSLSKDYENVIRMIEYAIGYGYKISSDRELRTVVRYVNDRKIHDFLVSLGFEYETDDDGVTEILSTSKQTGVVNLKKYIETVIYNRIKNLQYDIRYKDNLFIKQLAINKMRSSLFNEDINYIGLYTNLNNPDNLDKVLFIKDAFYQIQDVDINGHTVFEWLFIYDLLVNKHSLGANSITQLFDNKIDLSNSDSIISKWVSFVNEYDDNFLPYENYSADIHSLGFQKKRYSNDYEMINYRRRTYDRARYNDPNKFPLYINKKILGINSLFKIKDVFNAFKSGKIILMRC